MHADGNDDTITHHILLIVSLPGDALGEAGRRDRERDARPQ